MNCRQVQEKVEAYYEGALSAEDKCGVDIHLVQCQECNQELREVDALIAMCRETLEGEDSPLNFRDTRKGMAELDRRGREQAAKRRLFIRKDALMRTSFALVVIPAIWVFGLAIMHTYTVVTDWEPAAPAIIDIANSKADLPTHPVFPK